MVAQNLAQDGRRSGRVLSIHQWTTRRGRPSWQRPARRTLVDRERSGRDPVGMINIRGLGGAKIRPTAFRRPRSER